MRPTKSEYLLLVAEAVAKRATCPRRTVGCVLADKQARILATGYNGGLRGDPHCGTENKAWALETVYETTSHRRVILTSRDDHYPHRWYGKPELIDGNIANWVNANLEFDEAGRCQCAYIPGGSREDQLVDNWHLKPNAHGCAGLHDQPGQPSRCEAVHAELNALLQCRHREEVVFVACTTSPCLACARALVQGLVNLETVFYRDAYCNKEGLELLERRRVRCEQVKGGG